ncbi:hypothetical protein GYMLUDRAFT_311909 [Collybiopsis luxurians FD-317 M1]|nr:hypothetical protein GYMLUDRAFT_311909 [Collybiopsis luxurians FD-317 M1]
MSSHTTNFRSPSPALPGAWPYITRSISASDNETRHLGVPKLVSLSSNETLATTGTPASRNSQSSGLTQVQSGSSFSALATLSADSSDTTLGEDVYSPKSASSSSEWRIHQLPSPDTSHISQASRSGANLPRPDGFEHPLTGDTSFSPLSSETSSVEYPPSSQTPSPASSPQSLGSPISPIIFVSGSNRPSPAFRRFRGVTDQSYSFTSIEDAEYDDSDLLRLASPSVFSSPGSSVSSSRALRTQEDVSVVVVSPLTDGYSSSTEELELPSEPRLTSLSLSSIVNLDDSFPCDTAMPTTPCTGESTQCNVPWALSLSGVSEPNLPAPSPSPISVPLSPSPSLRAQLENPLATHVVTFPSHTLSSSPSPVLMSAPLTPSANDIDALENDATEYAVAVMMSSWGSTALQIEPIGLDFIQVSDPTQNDLASAAAASAHGRSIVVSSNPTLHKRGLLSKIKRLGVKFKDILQGKSKERLAVQVSSSRRTTDVLDICPSTAAASPVAPLPSLELDLDRHNLEQNLNASSSGPFVSDTHKSAIT